MTSATGGARRFFVRFATADGAGPTNRHSLRNTARGLRPGRESAMELHVIPAA